MKMKLFPIYIIFLILSIFLIGIGASSSQAEALITAHLLGNETHAEKLGDISQEDWGDIFAQIKHQKASSELAQAELIQVDTFFPHTAEPFQQDAYLKASNAEAGDWFGVSVAIDGDTLVVGAPHECSNAQGVNGDQEDDSAPLAGAAYVFVRSDGEWSQQAYLKASNAEAGDLFGYSVAIDGDTILVGAPYEYSSAEGVNGNQENNSAPQAGAAYIFVRSDNGWSQQAYLKAFNTDAGDRFGWKVAIQRDTIVVGAFFEYSNAQGVNGDQNDNSAPQAGAAYVFVRSDGEWSQEAYLKASNAEAGDWFGFSLAIDGDTLVVSAPHEYSSAQGVNGDQEDDSAPLSGAAYVFVRSEGGWSQQAYLKASNAEAGDWFGASVAIDRGTIVVTASAEYSSAQGVNGDQEDNSAPESGAAYVFVYSSDFWSQQAYLKASNAEAMDCLCHVAIYSDMVVLGACLEDSNARGVNGDQENNTAPDAGAAYVFMRSSGSWSSRAYLKAFNTDTGDGFGILALDRNTIVVSAFKEYSSAQVVNGDQEDNSAPESGAVYTYIFNLPNKVFLPLVIRYTQ